MHRMTLLMTLPRDNTAHVASSRQVILVFWLRVPIPLQFQLLSKPVGGINSLESASNQHAQYQLNLSFSPSTALIFY
jgi:hypothetical protein